MSPKNLDRREFLVSAASGAVVAGVAAGADEAQAATGGGGRYDLIVVGGGNAGMPAAIFAAARGARVLIIEAAGQLGGTLHLSSGQMSAGGTKLQKSKGIEDSGQLHFDDVMRISKGTADKDIVRLATLNAADTFDWLMDHGLDVYPDHPILGTTHEPYSRPRYAWGKNGGRSILRILNEQIQPHIDAKRITVLLDTKAKELIKGAGGAVTGVVAEDAKGARTRHLADNVLLTAGGCASNKEMFEITDAPLRNYNDSSYPYSQGEGIALGQSVGGYVRNGEHHLMLLGGILESDDYPSPMIQGFRPWPVYRPPYEIFVNVEGRRFLREDVPSHDAMEEALRKQTGVCYWIVFDDDAFYQAPQVMNPRRWSREQYGAMFNKRPFFHKADTLESLAKLAGFDAANFAQTVAEYNAAQDGGTDPLGRKVMPVPVKRAPFYAIKAHGWKYMSFGGLAADGQLRVLRKDGSPVPNLYAAGEILGAGTTMGRSHVGGMCVTPALTLGRLLGQQMLKFRA